MTKKSGSAPTNSDTQSECETDDTIETRAHSSTVQAQKDLNAIREIINAQAIENLKTEQKNSARNTVMSVFSEALYDRQKQDQSVSKILIPIVEEAVQKSVSSQRKQLTDYLYPLVGELARKYSIAFLRDFIEKTNELIEKSLSPKSLLWRFRAWRSGVSFSRYVASQIYTFQIHQVLLIHKETGTLLNSESVDGHHHDDSDLVSAMLSAINDFINDSFATKNKLSKSPNKNQRNTNNESLGLDEIRTDKFILFIRQGPQALLVAAVTGNISPKAKYKLQTTLEQIHSIYLPELQNFKGDTSVLQGTSVHLRECLIEEEKKVSTSKKLPWFALIIIFLALIASCYYGVVSWQTNNAEDKLYDLPMDQGIVLNSTEVTGLKSIELIVFRDPNAITIEEWLNLHPSYTFNVDWLNFIETPYSSLAPAILKRQVLALVNNFNQDHEFSDEQKIIYEPTSNKLSGSISNANKMLFYNQIHRIAGIEQLAIQDDIKIIDANEKQLNISQRAMTLLSGEIAKLQIEFGLGSSEIRSSELEKLSMIYERFLELKSFANEGNLSAKLLILGASDSVGNKQVNQTLSIERAQNTAQSLIAMGLDRNDIMTSGLGIINDAPEDTNVRKAIIHVVLNNKGL